MWQKYLFKIIHIRLDPVKKKLQMTQQKKMLIWTLNESDSQTRQQITDTGYSQSSRGYLNVVLLNFFDEKINRNKLIKMGWKTKNVQEDAIVQQMNVSFIC